MIDKNNDFLTNITERWGARLGGLYTTWHDMYSTELSYKWLEENDYPIEIVLESKYQNALCSYLLEQFAKWYKEQLIEG